MSLSFQARHEISGVMDNVMDCSPVESEFELQ